MKTVLVIEDEVNLVELLRVNLAAAGFNVISAGDGESGVREAVDKLPDAVILDKRLPGLDGLNVCRLIKGNPLTKNIPIIFLTAATQKADLEAALAAGCDYYMTKPFDIMSLTAKIKQLAGLQ